MSLAMRELVIVVLLVAAILWPYARVLSRAGYSPWLCILMAVPVLNLIGMWVFAYADWPALHRRNAQ